MPINVVDLGLVGDDSTDNTSALQTALDTYDALHFPAGTFRTGEVTATDRTRVSISGTGTIKTIPSAPAFTQVFNLTNCSNVTFQGVTFDGNKANQTQPPGADAWNGPTNRRQNTAIEMLYCSRVTISGCTFENFTTTQIAFGTCSVVDILNSTFRDSYMDAIYTFDSASRDVRVFDNTITDLVYVTWAYANGMIVNANNLRVEGNTVTNVDRSGLKPWDGSATLSGCVIKGNTISVCGFHGINPQNGSDLTIDGNTIFDIQGGGILISGTTNTMTGIDVLRNDITNVGLDGTASAREGIAVINNVDGLKVRYNEIDTASRIGIRLYEPKNFVVEENTITDTVLAGIALWGDAVNFPEDGEIKNNTLTNPGANEIGLESSSGLARVIVDQAYTVF